MGGQAVLYWKNKGEKQTELVTKLLNLKNSLEDLWRTQFLKNFYLCSVVKFRLPLISSKFHVKFYNLVLAGDVLPEENTRRNSAMGLIKQ